MTGIRRPSCATPPGGSLFGHLAESTPLTCYERKTCIDADQLPLERTPTVFISKRQPAEARSKHHQLWYTHGLAPTCGPAQGNLCEVKSQWQVLKALCREDKEIDIQRVCKLCLKGEISMSTWNRKLNWMFKENAQLGEDYLRLKQAWT